MDVYTNKYWEKLRNELVVCEFISYLNRLKLKNNVDDIKCIEKFGKDDYFVFLTFSKRSIVLQKMN